MNESIRSILERLVATPNPYMMNGNEEEEFFSLQAEAEKLLTQGGNENDNQL